jgi:L-aspartate semialdehyde sulfurtransferase
MSIRKSYEEIIDKIRKKTAVVFTAEEISSMSKELSPSEIIKKVDVVTTATFGAMCSSGAFLNFGHTSPPMRMERLTLNGVPAHGGLAAVDTFIGATSENPDDFRYGGANVIQDLVEGKSVELEAWGKGTDCYPRKHIRTKISLNTINEATLMNPRNAYQNYNVATNTTGKIKYTYMGTLLPGMKNANYSTSGELSPLLNDPEMRTIGIGTRIFLCGAVGYVIWNGTQFHTTKEKNQYGVPVSNSATLAVIGNLKEMSAEFLRAAYYERYGVSLFVGIGIPIPLLDEDMARRVSIRNEQIETTILDYGLPGMPILGRTNYAELQSGSILIKGKEVRTAPVASLQKARQIAEVLKSDISEGKFELTCPVAMFPKGTSLNKLIDSEGGEL